MEIDLEIFELTDPSAKKPEQDGAEAQAKAEAPAKFVKGLQIRGDSETIVGRSHPLLTEVLDAMGVPLKALPPTQPVTVDQLSAATRALAAADVLYESGRIRQAGIYYDKAVAVDGKNLEAALGRARVLAVQRKNDESLQAYQYARELAPNEAAPALEMAELDDSDRARQAATLLAAGKLSAAELRTRPAHKSLSLAQRLDPRLTASAEEESAALHQSLGEHSQAVQAFQLAVEKGGGSVARFHGLAKSQRVLGENEGAELSLLQAVELDENNEVVIRELGDVSLAAMFFGSGTVAIVGHFFFWATLVAHIAECVLKRDVFARAGGSMGHHVVQTMIYGLFHWKPIEERLQREGDGRG